MKHKEDNAPGVSADLAPLGAPDIRALNMLISLKYQQLLLQRRCDNEVRARAKIHELIIAA